MKIVALLTIIFFTIQSSQAQTKTFKSNLFPVTFSLSDEWTAEDNTDYKKIILTHKVWGQLLIEKVEKMAMDAGYSYIKKLNFLDSTGKVYKNLDFQEGITSINGKAAKYMIGVAKEGSDTNGYWTYLHYFIEKSNTEFYYLKANIRANAKAIFETAINSFVIL